LKPWKLIAPLFPIAECAKVVVQKIPTESTRTDWSVTDQRSADKIERFRYYRRCPYPVKTDFPFDSSDRYVLGTLSPDQMYDGMDLAHRPPLFDPKAY
jgi:hypothetical protein